VRAGHVIAAPLPVHEEMRATPELILEITTSVPDLAFLEQPPVVPESYTPDQMQRTVPCDGEIHAFDMVMNTEAKARELPCPGPCRWSCSAAARAERRTQQQKASDTKQT